MSGEKTEKPTPKKLRQARREGQVARSQDVGTWASMLLASTLLPMAVRRGAERMPELLERAAVLIRAPETGPAVTLLRDGLTAGLDVLLPLLLGTLGVALVAHALQGGVHVAPKLARPQLKRLNPLTGLKRIFGPQGAWELGKVVLKSTLIALVLWRGLAAVVPSLARSGALPLSTVLATVAAAALAMVRDASIAGLVLAAVDYAVVRRRIGGQLRMSKQEVKEEMRSSEGDPHVRAAIRSRQMAMSRNRMMVEVAKADVVLVNPIHVAVALRYDPARGAPRVVAKGAGAVAARIRAEAEAHRVPMVEDVPLARALHRACELGQEIPAELYTAVARVLAFVLSLRARGSAAGLHRPPQLSSRP